MTSHFKSSSHCFSHRILCSSTWPFRRAKYQRRFWDLGFPCPCTIHKIMPCKRNLVLIQPAEVWEHGQMTEEGTVRFRPGVRGLQSGALSRSTLGMQVLSHRSLLSQGPWEGLNKVSFPKAFEWFPCPARLFHCSIQMVSDASSFISPVPPHFKRANNLTELISSSFSALSYGIYYAKFLMFVSFK